jgi:hypothetical protein
MFATDPGIVPLDSRLAKRVHWRSHAIQFAMLITACFVLPLPSAQAETCSKQFINGEQVTICCDGNGVCYKK